MRRDRTGCGVWLAPRSGPGLRGASAPLLAKLGSLCLLLPPTATLTTREGRLGSAALPALRSLQGQAEGSVVPTEPCQRVGGGGVRPGALQTAACSALPHLSESMKCIWTAGLAPTQRPPSGLLICTSSSLDRAPVGLHPRHGWRASWPQLP